MCGSANKWVQRLTKSKKYGTNVLTADLGIMLGPGFPVEYSLQLGVRNDAKKWIEHNPRRARVYPWEYMLGDKARIDRHSNYEHAFAAWPLHMPSCACGRCTRACPSS